MRDVKDEARILSPISFSKTSRLKVINIRVAAYLNIDLEANNHSLFQVEANKISLEEV